MINIAASGQLGNWLFHTAAAIKRYGKVDNVYNTYLKYEEWKKAKPLWESLTNIPVFFGTKNGKQIINDTSVSNWQSLKVIPSREECRKIFNVKSVEPCKSPVIHVRGTDYFTFFKMGEDEISLGRNSIVKIADKFGCTTEDCIVVTDDIKYVESLGLKFKDIISKSPYEDFIFMANAERLCISNSTFSWWAGFLGMHKQVLIPIGVGPWDMKTLSYDKFSAQSSLEMCWGEECEPIYVL